MQAVDKGMETRKESSINQTIISHKPTRKSRKTNKAPLIEKPGKDIEPKLDRYVLHKEEGMSLANEGCVCVSVCVVRNVGRKMVSGDSMKKGKRLECLEFVLCCSLWYLESFLGGV